MSEISFPFCSDFHSGNIHVVLDKNGTLKEAKLLDYGYPGLLAIDPTTKKEVLVSFFHLLALKILSLSLSHRRIISSGVGFGGGPAIKKTDRYLLYLYPLAFPHLCISDAEDSQH